MKKNGTAAVIGAGFGGLAMGIRLQAMGFKTTIYEKNEQVGGHASQLKINGFVFDMGPSIITVPFLIQELFALNNEKMEDYLNIELLDPFYRVYFHDKSYIDYSGNKESMIKQIAQLNKNDAKAYPRFMEYSKRLYEIVIEEGLGAKPFLSYLDFFKFAPKALRNNAVLPGYTVVKKYFKDFRTRFLFSFHPLFLGGSPFNSPSIFLMLPYLEQKEGVWFSKGGMYSLVTELRLLFERMGGNVVTNAEVDEIIVENKTAKGLNVNGESKHYDLVVSNAHSAHTYTKLIDKRHREKLSDKRVLKQDYSMSCFLLFLGTNKKFENLKHHTLILSERYKGLIDDIFKKKIIPEDFSMYLHAPTKTDPSMAPPGCESMYVLIPVANLENNLDWSAYSEKFADKIIDFLENDFGMVGLRKSLVVKEHFTPQDFEVKRNNHLGAAWSVQPKLTQIATLRPHNKSEEIENLYLVGASTHPGSGVPGVILGAKATENAIKKHYKTE